MNKDKDPEKGDIPEHIQKAWHETAAERGNCPASEKLIAFQQRLLPAEELLQVRQHIDACGLCDWQIVSLDRFDSATQQTEEKNLLITLRRFLLNPALAYLIVLALAYPAYRGLFQEPEVREKIVTRTRTLPASVEGVAPSRMFSLGEATRQRNSISKSIPVIELFPEEKFFILNFFLPVHPDHRYEMKIKDPGGDFLSSAEQIRSRDAVGNFSIVASSKLFSDNQYSLEVSEFDQTSGRLVDKYSFPFRVKHRIS